MTRRMLEPGGLAVAVPALPPLVAREMERMALDLTIGALRTDAHTFVVGDDGHDWVLVAHWFSGDPPQAAYTKVRAARLVGDISVDRLGGMWTGA